MVQLRQKVNLYIVSSSERKRERRWGNGGREREKREDRFKRV